MKARELTVYRGSGRNYDPIPQIIMQGRWLSDLGFSIGDKVAITHQEGKIVIEHISDGQARQGNPDTEKTAECRGRRHTYDRY